MKENAIVIPFPSVPEYFRQNGHSLSGGGMPMKVTHQHPTYASRQERQERLKDLKRICAMKLKRLDDGPRTA